MFCNLFLFGLHLQTVNKNKRFNLTNSERFALLWSPAKYSQFYAIICRKYWPIWYSKSDTSGPL